MEWAIENLVQLMFNLGHEWGILIINLVIILVLIMASSIVVKFQEIESNSKEN